MEGRQLGEAAGHIGGGHGRAVAGHGGGDEAAANVRQSVNDKRTALGGRDGAGVGRQTVGLDSVNVGDAGELVEHGQQEHGHELIRDTQHIREAGHKLTHGHLIEENETLIEGTAVAIFAVALCEQNKSFCDEAVHAVYQLVAHTEVIAAHAHCVLIHEAVAAEIGDHPAVVQSGVECGDEVLGEGHQQHAPHACPLIEVISGVLDTAPLTADGSHGALAVQAAEAALTVEDDILLVLGVESHESVELFLDALAVGLRVLYAVKPELLPVGSLEHVPCYGADFLEVLPLRFPVYLVLAAEKLGIRVLYLFLLSHYALPSSLWMRLISRDSTKA